MFNFLFYFSINIFFQELFGRIGAVRYDDAEFGRGSILMTLVDDGYIEGIKILAWVFPTFSFSIVIYLIYYINLFKLNSEIKPLGIWNCYNCCWQLL